MNYGIYKNLLNWYKTYGYKYPLDFRARFSQYLLLTRKLNNYELNNFEK